MEIVCWTFLKTFLQTVDTDYLSQSMSEMLDMSFSSSVSEIFEECEEALLTEEPVCPALPYPEEEDDEEVEEEEKEDKEVEPGEDVDEDAVLVLNIPLAVSGM